MPTFNFFDDMYSNENPARAKKMIELLTKDILLPPPVPLPRPITWEKKYMATCSRCHKLYDFGDAHTCDVEIIDCTAEDVLPELPPEVK